jgi:acyl carrier protein
MMHTTEQEVFDKLLPLVQEITGASEDRIRMETVLVEDLGAESLDLLDLSFLIEETFGVTFGSDDFERQARAGSPGEEYDRDGLLTAEAILRLREALPEVPPEKLQPGMPKVTLPRVLNVAVFVHQIQRKLAEAQKEEAA